MRCSTRSRYARGCAAGGRASRSPGNVSLGCRVIRPRWRTDGSPMGHPLHPPTRTGVVPLARRRRRHHDVRPRAVRPRRSVPRFPLGARVGSSETLQTRFPRQRSWKARKTSAADPGTLFGVSPGAFAFAPGADHTPDNIPRHPVNLNPKTRIHVSHTQHPRGSQTPAFWTTSLPRRSRRASGSATRTRRRFSTISSPPSPGRCLCGRRASPAAARARPRRPGASPRSACATSSRARASISTRRRNAPTRLRSRYRSGADFVWGPGSSEESSPPPPPTSCSPRPAAPAKKSFAPRTSRARSRASLLRRGRPSSLSWTTPRSARREAGFSSASPRRRERNRRFVLLRETRFSALLLLFREPRADQNRNRCRSNKDKSSPRASPSRPRGLIEYRRRRRLRPRHKRFWTRRCQNRVWRISTPATSTATVCSDRGSSRLF